MKSYLAPGILAACVWVGLVWTLASDGVADRLGVAMAALPLLVLARAARAAKAR